MRMGMARVMLGKDKIIGLTAHDTAEAITAQDFGADYVGASPIFETTTKLDAGKASGLKLIEDMKKEGITIPIVGIGGINLDNVESVIKAGADSAVAISAVVTKDDVEEECRKFIIKIRQSK